MLDNRFNRISQYFSESDGVEYYSAYSYQNTKSVWTALFTKIKTDKGSHDFRLRYDRPSEVHPRLFINVLIIQIPKSEGLK